MLEPDWIDPLSNYRYYSDSQLSLATRVCELRSLGLTPKQIRALLADGDRDAVTAQIRSELVAELANQQRRLERFDKLLVVDRPEPIIEPPIIAVTSLDWVTTERVTAIADSVVNTVRRGFVALRRDANIDEPFAATFPLDLVEETFDIEIPIEAIAMPDNRRSKRFLRTLHVGPTTPSGAHTTSSSSMPISVATLPLATSPSVTSQPRASLLVPKSSCTSPRATNPHDRVPEGAQRMKTTVAGKRIAYASVDLTELGHTREGGTQLLAF